MHRKWSATARIKRGDNVRNWNGLIQSFLLARPVDAVSFTDLSADPDGAIFSSLRIRE